MLLLAAGDRLKLGVDVVENNTASHKCVQFSVVVHLPNVQTASRTPPPPTMPIENEIPLTVLTASGEDMLLAEVCDSGGDVLVSVFERVCVSSCSACVYATIPHGCVDPPFAGRVADDA